MKMVSTHLPGRVVRCMNTSEFLLGRFSLFRGLQE